MYTEWSLQPHLNAACSYWIIILSTWVIYKHVVVCYFITMPTDELRDFLYHTYFLHFLHFKSFERLNSDLLQQRETMIIRDKYLYCMLGLMTSYYRHRWCSEQGKPNFFGHTFCDSQRKGDRDRVVKRGATANREKARRNGIACNEETCNITSNN